MKELFKKLTKKFQPTPKDIPGFELYKDPEKGWVYRAIDFRKDHRSSVLMAVNPKYDVLREIELLGYPRVMVHEQMAKSPRTEEVGSVLPSLDELMNEQYYLNLLSSPKGPLYEYDWLQREFRDYEERNKISGYISSPIEIHRRNQNVFIFPGIVVEYTHALQFFGKSDRFWIKGAGLRKYEKNKIDLFSEPEEIDGLAYVAHVRVPVDFRDYFKTADEVGKFGALPDSEKEIDEASYVSLAYDIFNKLFKEKLEIIGQKVEEVRKCKVKGVLLSPIKSIIHIADNILTIGSDPEGEMVIAASYLA